MKRVSNGSKSTSVLERNSSSLIVVTGYIVVLGRLSVLNSPRAGIFRIKWDKDRIPDGAKLGSKVTIVGKLITLNLGRSFLIKRAKSYDAIKMKKLKRFFQEEMNE